jgi:hypothetical protein
VSCLSGRVGEWQVWMRRPFTVVTPLFGIRHVLKKEQSLIVVEGLCSLSRPSSQVVLCQCDVQTHHDYFRDLQGRVRWVRSCTPSIVRAEWGIAIQHSPRALISRASQLKLKLHVRGIFISTPGSDFAIRLRLGLDLQHILHNLCLINPSGTRLQRDLINLSHAQPYAPLPTGLAIPDRFTTPPPNANPTRSSLFHPGTSVLLTSFILSSALFLMISHGGGNPAFRAPPFCFAPRMANRARLWLTKPCSKPCWTRFATIASISARSGCKLPYTTP